MSRAQPYLHLPGIFSSSYYYGYSY
jgi:hypothetical protein